MISITETAKEEIEKIMKDESITDSHFLRVGVKGGGCSGLEYEMDFDDSLNEGDEKMEDKGITIVCDKKSLLYLFGTELNYSGGLNGKGFEWINPNANRTCSCGSSFSL